MDPRKGDGTQGPAHNPAEEPVSPQMARSVQASATRWRQVMTEHQFLSSEEVDELLGSRTANRSLASRRRSEGKLLAVEQGNVVLYPAFQFDEAGVVRPVIAELIALATQNDWSEQSLTLWLVTPTGYFDDKPPVKCLNDPDKVLAAARSRFKPSW